MEKVNLMTVDVELLKQHLGQRRFRQDRFRLPFTKDVTAAALIAAVQTEVEKRGAVLQTNDSFISQIDTVAEWLSIDAARDDRRFGILLSGPCGNGKSSLMYAIQNLINVLQLKNPSNNGKWGMVIRKARDIADECKSNYAEFKRLCGTPMLAIDDLGTEPREVIDFGNHYYPLIDLVDRRYSDQLFTMITSNMTPKEIGKRYGERTAERLSEMMLIVEYDNASYRY